MSAFDPTRIDSGETTRRTGCFECEAEGGWWFHLRRCTACGHIGCCDSSPSQHASAHAAETGHPVICSYEPDEDWCWSYETRDAIAVPGRVAALHHPRGQPTPGPAGRVPQDWMARLH